MSVRDTSCFNPRPRAGGDGCRRLRLRMRKRFNPRPRAGGDFAAAASMSRAVSVSIHAPARGATQPLRDVKHIHETFQSTPPRGGRLIEYRRHWYNDMFQSTPPRGGRQHPIDMVSRYLNVSIHAPARGATDSCCSQSQDYFVFQSTPPRGGRHHPQRSNSREHGFQSTPPRGGRPGYHGGCGDSRSVSIHAPARGATSGRCSRIGRLRSFNPRPRAGGDSAISNCRSGSVSFQSTPPRGGRHSIVPQVAVELMFQSTPPRGGRQAE